jgi:hypothetical protein
MEIAIYTQVLEIMDLFKGVITIQNQRIKCSLGCNYPDIGFINVDGKLVIFA